MSNNEFLLTSSHSAEQYSACLWNYQTLNVQKVYKNGGVVAPKCLELIGQDYLLSAEMANSHLHVWPLNSQEIATNGRWILPEPADCLTVCPSSVYIAAGINCKVYIWHISSGKLLSVQQTHSRPITCIRISSYGEFLLTGGQDGVLVVHYLGNLVAIFHNSLTRNEVGQTEPVYTKNDHSFPINDIHVGGLLGSTSRFATVSSDQSCRIYNLRSGELLLTLVFDQQLTAVIFDRPCWRLFIGAANGDIQQFNLKNPPMSNSHHIDEKTSLLFKAHKNKVTCIALNILDTILASGGEDCCVYTWDVNSRQVLKKIDHKGGITNIKFVTGYRNFFVEQLTPRIVLKELERTLQPSDKYFTVSQIQTEDIVLSDDENSSKEKNKEDLLIENRRLQAVNRQLYRNALEISRRYAADNSD